VHIEAVGNWILVLKKLAMARMLPSTANRNFMINYLTKMPNTKRVREEGPQAQTRRPRRPPRGMRWS
jgi:hypothetical protein